MADATLPVVTPGSQTSEFNLAKIVTTAGTVIAILFGLLSQAQGVIPGGSKAAGYIAAALAVLGIVMKILVTLGYTDSRTQQKVAAINAAGAAAAAQTITVAKTPEAAAAELGK